MLLRPVENLQRPKIMRTRSSLNGLSRTQQLGSLSVHAFEFKTLYGLDTLVQSTTHPTLNVRVNTCLGTQLFCRLKVLIGTTQQDETIDTSADTTSSDHPGRNPLSQARE